MNILILGASRGIGLEFVRQYREANHVVTATARDAEGLVRITALGAKALKLEVTDPASISGLGWQLDGEKVDLALYVAGVMSRGDARQAPARDDFDRVMHTNVLGPMRVIPQLVDALAEGARLGVISSRMGSMGLRASADGWLYRASKAAVNSVLKDASIALAGRAICVALHPGWVRTDMGGDGADLDVAESAGALRATLAALTPADNGRFLNHDGQGLDW